MPEQSKLLLRLNKSECELERTHMYQLRRSRAGGGDIRHVPSLGASEMVFTGVAPQGVGSLGTNIYCNSRLNCPQPDSHSDGVTYVWYFVTCWLPCCLVALYHVSGQPVRVWLQSSVGSLAIYTAGLIGRMRKEKGDLGPSP